MFGGTLTLEIIYSKDLLQFWELTIKYNHKRWTGVYSLKPRNLNKPSHIVRIHFIVNHPASQTGPFIPRSSINWYSVLCILILAFFKISNHLFHKLGKVFPLDVVISFEKDLSQFTITLDIKYMSQSVTKNDPKINFSINTSRTKGNYTNSKTRLSKFMKIMMTEIYYSFF